MEAAEEEFSSGKTAARQTLQQQLYTKVVKLKDDRNLMDIANDLSILLPGDPPSPMSSLDKRKLRMRKIKESGHGDSDHRSAHPHHRTGRERGHGVPTLSLAKESEAMEDLSFIRSREKRKTKK